VAFAENLYIPGDGQGGEIDWGTVKDYAAHRWWGTTPVIRELSSFGPHDTFVNGTRT
jgi:hypothetical protein